MEFKKQINGNEITLSFEGRVDTTNSSEFEEIIFAEIKKDATVIVDFTGIEYISSAGLRALLSSHKQCLNVGAKLVLKHVNSDVLEVFDITGFSSILNIED